MTKRHLRRILEISWVAASLLFILFGARSFIRSRYPDAWDSWVRLPWYQKLQPLELTLERYLGDSSAQQEPALLRATETDVEAAMLAGADWLLLQQEASGRFKYWYDPIRDEFSAPAEDNFHRQAGTAYGLTLVYEMSGDPRYLGSAQRSVEYLFRYKQTLAPDKTYFFAEERADLGGAALSMLILIRLRELTGSTAHDLELKRLANFLLFLQNKYDTGEFKSTYVYRGDYDIEAKLQWQSPISPGQAMLALAWMYRNFRDPVYKDSIDKGLNFYSDERHWKRGGFLPWTISAFVSMYSETREARYARYVTLLTDYLISGQNLDTEDDVFGSFGSFPSVASASHLEALGDALQLTQESGDSSREALYRQRARLGYAWLISLQYGRHNTEGLPDPGRSLGGFARSRNDPHIRIDYNQHAISALARGLRFVFGRQPMVTLSGGGSQRAAY